MPTSPYNPGTYSRKDVAGILELTRHDLEYISTPRWEELDGKSIHVHDWRRYIPPPVKTLWPRLAWETRTVAYYLAQLAAEAEEPALPAGR